MNCKILFGLLGVFLLSLKVQGTPAISSFSPNYGWSNSVAVPGNVIDIAGSGFYPGALVVKFNGVLATNFQATDTFGTNIQAQIRIGTPSGPGPVVVTVNGVQAPTNNGVLFTVIGPNDSYVTDFSPSSGVAGSTMVTFNGIHFTGVNGVKFNGTSVPGFSPPSDDTTFTATVPAGAQTGPISLTKSGAATFVSATNFYVSPTITSFSPSSGRAGTNVVIRGTSFTNVSVVKFGSVNAASFTVDSNAQITAVAPNGVVTGTITVIAPAGTFITSTNFTVQPTISSFTPGFGPSGTAVTISGANLDAGSFAVTFNGMSAGVGTRTFSSAAVTAPASTTGPIVVTTAGGTATSSANFYYPGFMSGLTPNNGAPGATVKITGGNFTGATAVTFNGQPAASFVVSNNTTIGAVVPAGVSTGTLNVTTPAGVASNGGIFYAAPVINSFTPTHKAPGTRVTINGTNLLSASAVLFNGTNASFTVTNNGVIGATVPNNAPSGPLTVVAPGGTNVSAGSFTVDYTSDISVFITNAPGPVFVTSNLVYTVTVANYAGPNDALNVMLTNTLPTSVLLKSASTTQGTLNTNGNPITAVLGTIPSGNSAILTLTVVPQTVGTITDTASAGSDNADPTPANNGASNVTLVWPLPILGIQNLTSNQIKVFWPAPLSNFTLLTKSNLVPLTAAWSTDLTARVVSGTNISVTEINSNTAKFFRLKQ